MSADRRTATGPSNRAGAPCPPLHRCEQAAQRGPVDAAGLVELRVSSTAGRCSACPRRTAPRLAGTTTRRMPSSAATAPTCSPAAPPNASRAKPRGSTPRRTVATRTPSAMRALTRRCTPAAAASSQSKRGAQPGERRVAAACPASARPPRTRRVQVAEHQVSVGHGRRGAAPAVAGRAGTAPALSGPTGAGRTGRYRRGAAARAQA